MAINNQAVSPASTANEHTKPVLSMQIIDLFRTYAWAVMGELVTNRITPFNITFEIESSACVVALKFSHLVTMESGGAAMSFTDVQEFQQNDTTFPATTAACGHHLGAHNIFIDLMVGEMAPFGAMAYYWQCIQQLL